METLSPRPASFTSLSMRCLSAWNSCSSCAAAWAWAAAAFFAAAVGWPWAFLVAIASLSASAGVSAAIGCDGEDRPACEVLPVCWIAWPPLSTGPENASWRDCVSSLTLLTFVDEIAKSTTNTANSSVIMS